MENILSRFGNKQKLAKKIIAYFPKHKYYFEPFFGTGSIFFMKPKVQYNYLNDLDEEVFNFYMVLLHHKNELLNQVKNLIIHKNLFEYWNKTKENDKILKALRFLYLSNFSYLGLGNMLRFGDNNVKKILINNIVHFDENILSDCQFNNVDFRKFFKQFAFHHNYNIDNTFVYCDPPYLQTANNYSSEFSKQDSIDLFDTLQKFGAKWAMSEFDNPFILEQAKKRKLNIYYLEERRNIKNRRIEVLITNYKNYPTLF